jgi:MFS family permease
VAASGKWPDLLINRNFALLLGGQAVSAIGDQVFNTTLVVWIALQLARHQPWAPLAVSGVLLAAAMPVLLVGPLAGVFVDRWDKRHTMLAMSVLQAVVVAALLIVSGVLPLPFVPGGRLPLFWQLGVIYGAVFLINAGEQFFAPATLALIGDTIEADLQPRATGLRQMNSALATIVGPPLAAPLLFAFGVQWALLIDALSFVVAFLAVLAIRAPRAARSLAMGQRGGVAGEFGAGVRFLLGNRTLVTLLIAAGIASLGAGALNALDIFFVTRNLHTPGTLYGFVGAAYAFGILVGAVLASALVQRIGLTRTVWGSLLALGIFVLVWSRMTSFPPALAVLFLGGIPEAMLNTAAGPLVLRATPRDLVGRVSALVTPTIMLAMLISVAVAGYLDSTVLSGPMWCCSV